VESLVYITDNAFTAREVLMMETQVLRALRFDIASATAHAFAVRFLRFVDANDVVRHLTHVRRIALASVCWACAVLTMLRYRAWRRSL